MPAHFRSSEIERRPETFVGKTVTMAGKDPVRWENTTITRYEDGKLFLSGGEQVTRIFEDEPTHKPITESWVFPCDVARGVIHEAGHDV